MMLLTARANQPLSSARHTKVDGPSTYKPNTVHPPLFKPFHPKLVEDLDSCG